MSTKGSYNDQSKDNISTICKIILDFKISNLFRELYCKIICSKGANIPELVNNVDAVHRHIVIMITHFLKASHNPLSFKNERAVCLCNPRAD